jgi:2Fe-2S ferredoxin
MPKITFINANDQNEETIDAEVGLTLMEAAKNCGIAGVDGDCGGACICGTCHVYIGSGWTALVGGPSDIEEATMEFSEDVRPESRLACQIMVSDELDGLVVHIPLV